jgi:hypothetical protein
MTAHRANAPVAPRVFESVGAQKLAEAVIARLDRAIQ